MAGKKDLSLLQKELTPILNPGEFVFVTTKDSSIVNNGEAIGQFKEKEGFTLILERGKARELGLSYDYIASWITLSVHSSLEAVGLTALFSTELAKHEISCNVIAGYYHDHIFVAKKDADRAMTVLSNLAENKNKQ
ncbi:ACT domain-containing protein [Maribacter sp. MJ134]|uniref:ACT domain-containing protein n=1 Tax=Maribacter sp. MJ134 TaxID=2496865 RepID=UPI000F8378DE|nr:ACT domain-containing protein [Maribacter sp. MJ134]AZQ59714.1 ACT domain-containing protein [Maribacter sp. MJ134]